MQKKLCLFFMTLLLGAGASAVASNAGATGPASAATTSPAKTATKADTASDAERQRTKRIARLKIEQDIMRYKDAIEALESSQGVYGSDISEQLDALGTSLQKLGDHNEAIDVFKRGVHLTRISEGLYTPNQIRMVEKQIYSHAVLGQWLEVDKRQSYLYWLGTMNYTSDDPQILPTYSRMARWHMQAYRMQLGRDKEKNTEHLLKAYGLIEKSIDIMEGQEVINETQMVAELRALVLANYLFATYQRVMPERIPQQFIRSSAYNTPEINHSMLVIDQYIHRSFRSGKRAIDKVINIYEQSETAEPWQVVKAKVQLGDWLFMFNKRDAAFAEYQAAYGLLQQFEETHPQLDKLFERPVALPNQELMNSSGYEQAQTAKAAIDNDAKYVLASFDVTPQGRASNIEIIESNPPDNISARSQVKQSLRVAKFRPRFVEGEPALTEKMQLRVMSYR